MAEIRIAASKLIQKDKILYLFKMKSSLIKKISYVTPRSENNPNELQRVYSEQRAKEIGTWLKEENSLLPNAIVIDLKDVVRIEDTADSDIVTIILPDPEVNDENAKVAYILDGQHRIKGFEYSDGIEFDLPVIALHNMSDDIRGKVFIDINSKQVKVDERLLLDLMFGTHNLAQDDERIYIVIKGLNANSDSPINNKIQLLPEQKEKWIKNTALFKHLKPHLSNGGVLYSKTSGQQITIFTSYFSAFKEVYNDAWSNQEDFMLTKTQGFELMCGIFRELKSRCDLFEGQQYTKEAFKKQLNATIVGKLISLKLRDNQNISIPLDWKSSNFGNFSTRQWMVEIRKEVINLVNI